MMMVFKNMIHKILKVKIQKNKKIIIKYKKKNLIIQIINIKNSKINSFCIVKINF